MLQCGVGGLLGGNVTSFFDEIDHKWMVMFPGGHIADGRVRGIICKWLHAGAMEDGRRVAATWEVRKAQ